MTRHKDGWQAQASLLEWREASQLALPSAEAKTVTALLAELLLAATTATIATAKAQEVTDEPR